MSEDHSFSCDIDYTNDDKTVQILFEKQLTYYTSFFNNRTNTVPDDAELNEQRNAIRIKKSSWVGNQFFKFTCEVKHTDEASGKVYAGKAEKLYRTIQI